MKGSPGAAAGSAAAAAACSAASAGAAATRRKTQRKRQWRASAPLSTPEKATCKGPFVERASVAAAAAAAVGGVPGASDKRVTCGGNGGVPRRADAAATAAEKRGASGADGTSQRLRVAAMGAQVAQETVGICARLRAPPRRRPRALSSLINYCHSHLLRAPSPLMSAQAAAGAPPDAPPPAPPRSLPELRQLIDGVDVGLVQLLNERSRLVIEVGRRKAFDGTPVYAPHREQAVLARVLALNAGPTLPSTVESIYREIMSGSFALERPLRIGYLGPRGSFSHDAAVKQFGSSVAFEDLRVIAGVFDEVARGNVDYGVVPVENGAIGAVAETLDAFLGCADRVSVCAEMALSVAHAFIAAPGALPSDITEVHSKPEALAQCRRWLATQYPGARLVPAASSSAAVMALAAAHDAAPGAARHIAAVGSALAARLYDLPCMFTDIQDVTPNVTRFLVLCARGTAAAAGAASGLDKTSILFALDDVAGALASVLDSFRAASINLTHIDKRPVSAAQMATLVSLADVRAERSGEVPLLAPRAADASSAAARAGLSPSLFVAAQHGGVGGLPPPALYVFFVEMEGHISSAAVAGAAACPKRGGSAGRLMLTHSSPSPPPSLRRNRGGGQPLPHAESAWQLPARATRPLGREIPAALCAPRREHAPPARRRVALEEAVLALLAHV